MVPSQRGARAGPTTGGEQFEGRTRWVARPVVAFVVRLLAYLVPLSCAFAVTFVVARVVPWGREPAALLAAYVVLCALATSIFFIVERATRRLLPLAGLLQLSLAFPDQAPSRFGVALRAGGLKRMRERAGEDAAGDTDPVEVEATTEAAGHLLSLVYALNAHDRRTRGHCERVRAYAVMIGREMGVTGDELDKLQWASLLHDVGKLDVPAAILNKDGKPTDEEWSILSQHPADGVPKIAPLVTWLGEWARATGEHHERFDGRGYPGGLQGTEISMAGRIVCVADAFEVMTATRSYKKPLSMASARAELTRCSGEQFDPTVVRAMLAVSIGRLRRWIAAPIAWVSQIPVIGSASASPSASLLATGALVGGLTIGLVAAGPLPGDVDNGAAEAAALPIDADERAAAARPRSTARQSTGSSGVGGSAGTESSSGSSAAGASSAGGPARASGGPAPSRSGTNPTPRGGVPISPSPAPTPAPSPPPSPPPPPGPVTFYLGTNGTGNTTSSSVLPATANAPTIGGLPNYDTNRDAFAGLLVAKTGNGINETDPTKRQLWAIGSSGLQMRGSASLTIWAAVKDFNTSKRNEIVVALQDCDGSFGGCQLLAQAQTSYIGTNGWQAIQIPLGFIDATIASGRHFVIRVQFANNSDDDGWLAYGTTSFPASLTVG